MKRSIYIFCFLLCAIVASASDLSQKADSAYNKENYTEAIDYYLQSIAADGVSSDIYYNLGNAYYRENKIGKAIICYERALKIDPSNTDARINLEFVKTRIEDAPEDDSSFLSNLHYRISSLMNPNSWAVVALVLFIVLLGAVALYIFSSNTTIRKVGFFGGIVFIVVFIYTIVIAAQTSSEPFRHDTAIVIVPTTNLSSAPRLSNSQAEKVVPIHEGTKVTILDSVSTPDNPHVGKWYDVKINNSSRAWLNADDVEKI